MNDDSSPFLIIGAVVAVLAFFLWKNRNATRTDGTPDVPVNGDPPPGARAVSGPITRGLPPVPAAPVANTPIDPRLLARLRPPFTPTTTVGGSGPITAPRPVLTPTVPVTAYKGEFR